MKTDIGLGPQGEQIEERTVGKPVLSPMAGMVIRLFNRSEKTPVDDRIKRVLSLSPEDYAAVIWGRNGHVVKQVLQDAGYHDGPLIPGGRLTPDYLGIKNE